MTLNEADSNNNPPAEQDANKESDKSSGTTTPTALEDDPATSTTSATAAPSNDNSTQLQKEDDDNDDSEGDDSGDEKTASPNNNTPVAVSPGKETPTPKKELSKKELKKLEKEEKERLKREEKERIEHEKQEKERLKREEKERIEHEKQEKERMKREEKERQRLLKSSKASGSNRSLKSMVANGSSASSSNLLSRAGSSDLLQQNKQLDNNKPDDSSEPVNNDKDKDISKENENDKESTNDKDTNSAEADNSVEETAAVPAPAPPPPPPVSAPSSSSFTISAPSPASPSSGDKRDVVIKVTRAFAAVVHQNVLLEDDSETKMRNKVINELINTEKDYIADLKVIIHVILAPLRESKLLQDKDITTIFSNIQMLLSVNEVLLADLEKTARDNQGSSIGPCFKYLADYLKIYSSYCANQQISGDHLQLCIKKQPALKQFLDERQAMPECRQGHLDSFLIKPIQRLCKYPLLIREIIRNSDENHPDIPSLEQAYAKIQTTVITVNENKRKAEVQQKMYKIHEQLETTEKFDFLTPTRYLIREDTLKELTEEKDKIAGKSHYFLFNDIIMRTKKDKKSIKLETLFVIASTTITDNESHTDSRFCNTFELAQVGSAGRKFTLVCDTYEQKMEWMTDVEQLIRPYQEEYSREYEKLLDDFDPSKFKRSTIATGNPSAVDNSPKSLMRSATSSGLSTKHLPAVPSKPLPPPPPSHKSTATLKSEDANNNNNNSANATPNVPSPRTSTLLDSPVQTASPRASLILSPPAVSSPRSSLVLDTPPIPQRHSVTVVEQPHDPNKAPLPFIVKPKPPAGMPRKSINAPLSPEHQLSPTPSSPEHHQQPHPETPHPVSTFKPAPGGSGRPLPNPATMKPRALPQPGTSSPSSAHNTPVHSPPLSAETHTPQSPSVSTPAVNPSPSTPSAPRPMSFPKSAAALKNAAPGPSRSYSTLPSNSATFSPIAPAPMPSPSKDDNLITKKTIAPVLPPTSKPTPTIPPRSTHSPITTLAEESLSPSSKPLPNRPPVPPPTAKPAPPRR